MKKPRKSPIGIIKITLLIPAILITLGLTTGMTPQQKAIKGKVVFADTGEPAQGAAVIIEGTTVGTITDAEGLFMLEVDGNPNLVISFVGYSNLRIKPSAMNKKPLKLEPKVFELDPGSVPLGITKDILSVRHDDDLDKQPVFVLDGKVMKDFESIDPDKIEKVEVFKDPHSEVAKKYNAKNGVILITSKNKESIQTEKEVEAINDTNKPKHKGDEVFYVVEEMPMFPGGKAALITYIYSNLEYPESARKKEISGEVYVQFLVATSGKLEDIQIVRSTHQSFDKPALDVFKGMPAWNPGKQREKAVSVQVVVPVRFNADME